MKYFLLPFGCATNRADAERIASVLDQAGFVPTNIESEADILGIVACSIRQSAIDRVIGRARIWNKWRQKKPIITFLTGCVLPEDAKKLSKSFDHVIKLIEVLQLPELLRSTGNIAGETFWDLEPHRDSNYKALVPIQNGCDNYCTYCAVPYTRGREESRPAESILKEIDRLIKKQYKQITLLGQNVNSYGLDKSGAEMTFPELLEEIGKRGDQADHELLIYYTSPHPRDMTEQVYKIQAKYKCLAPYLNLPLQSGNNEILKRMNRQYTVEQYMEKLDKAREIIPSITVSTDIIVGFCGETKTQFKDTLKALECGKYDMAFIAQYSPRPHAVAGKRFNDDIPKEEKKRRDKAATEILRKTAFEHNKKLLNQTVRVLVENKSRKPGLMIGRTDGLKSVEFKGDESLIGNFIKVKITDCDAWRLSGKIT